jgi:bifunctional DNase/RNase
LKIDFAAGDGYNSLEKPRFYFNKKGGRRCCTGESMIPVKVKGIGLDPAENPLLLLIDKEETIILPIGIGLTEAQAITLKLEGYTFPRPLTYDLILTICENLGGSIEKIVVNDKRKDTYYAQIYLKKEGQEIVIDTRPSDAVALALTSGSPLFITDEVAKHSFPLEEVLQKDILDIYNMEDDEGNTLLH